MLLQEAKISCYNQIYSKIFPDNNKFWKTIKPVFSDKVKQSMAISLVENDEVVAVLILHKKLQLLEIGFNYQMEIQ